MKVWLENKCQICGEYHKVLINEEDYYAYLDGELVQDAFPYLTPDEREIIVTGICKECWDKMFEGCEHDS